MSMFHEVRLPDNIAFGMKGGPQYFTDIITDQQGNEYRNIKNSFALAKYKVNFKLQNQKQIDQLISFFRERKGKAYGFRFKDYLDFKAIGQVIAVADGVTKKFQLIKHYGKEIRIIKKPVQNTVIIYINNIKHNVNIDYNNGIILFDIAPDKSAIIKADFEFDVPVRFDNDSFNAVMVENNNFSWNDVDLVEIRLS